MKILANIFHPNLQTQSKVNKQWTEELKKNPQITLNLVYEQYPDWKIDMAREQKLLLEHDRVVFQHPFYWYSVPPLFKKWQDEVLTYGWAYGPGGKALQKKEWVSAISTGGPIHSYQAGGYNTFSMSELIKPLQQAANLIGMVFLPAFIFHGAVQASPEEVADSAKKYLTYITDPELNPQVRLGKLLAEMEKAGTKLEA